ncbi:30S ribosomal protein S8e [Candidatus Micrarchaeota archaeon]|nr:30S ribosomal protein S8e [Candidatus Micrarchaeota archaeon]
MVVSHAGKLSKKSGGRKRRLRDKREFETGSLPTNTKIGKTKRTTVRARGNTLKHRLRTVETANVLDQKTGKWVQARIITEKQNPANREFSRQNILTKGAVIETDAGLVRVTSRPGQHGVVNAVLVEAKK